MSTYNGYKNWAHWNVSLWINNDEGAYRRAVTLCRVYNKPDAAVKLFEEVSDMGVTVTPDGARYSISAIRSALVGI